MGLFSFLGFGSKGLIEKVLKLEGCGVGRCEVRRCEVRRLWSQIASSYLSVTSVSRVRKSKHLLFTFLERDVTTPKRAVRGSIGVLSDIRVRQYAERRERRSNGKRR